MNNSLREQCVLYRFGFVSNDNFSRTHLWKGRIHLEDLGNHSYETVITVMKMSFKKHPHIERHYRNYKYFDRTRFKNNLNEKLSEGISNY